ncbi:MAG: YHS domain-containing protein [Alphaproteobacteria bacterium]|nr:YHS domain-containing protein [Alphaproteobacteria bacterium]
MAMMALLFIAPAQAKADPPISTGTFNNTAVSGYDTVSYFTDGGPVKGNKEFQTQWKGADWYFVSQENLDKFKADPEQYAPQYGGYCAWAVAHGNTVGSDPLQYHIEEGKLYLNYSQSIKDQWLPRRKELIPLGDKEYPQLVD